MAASFGESARHELTEFLAPLQNAARDQRVLGDWLAEIGHTERISAEPALLDIARQAADLVQTLSALDATALQSWEGVGQVLETAGGASDLWDRLRGFALDPLRLQAAEGLPEDIMSLLLASYLRRRRPTLFRIGSLLTVVQARENSPVEPGITENGATVRYPHVLDRFRFAAINGLLSEPGETLRQAYFPNGLSSGADTWTAAAQLFPNLSYVADELGLAWRSEYPPVVEPAPPAQPADPGPDEDDFIEHPDPGDGSQPLTPAPPPPGDEYFAGYFPTFTVTIARAETADAQALCELHLRVSSLQHPAGVAGYVLTTSGAFNTTRSGERWKLTLSANGEIPGFAIESTKFGLAPNENGLAGGVAKVLLERLPPEGAPGPVATVGTAPGTRLELGSVSFEADVFYDPARTGAVLQFGASSCALVIAPADTDSLLASFLPGDGLSIRFDLGLVWSSGGGVTFRGAAGLDTTLPVGLSVGGLSLPNLYLGLRAADSVVAAEISGAVGLAVGPVHLLVDRVGLNAALTFPPEGGNLGAADLDIGFKPPSGVGLEVLAPGISGGGFIGRDPETGRYSGAFDLKAGEIDIGAVGLLDTGLAGHPRYALLIALHATFPAIQVGLGFALTGIGGLIALNRRVDVDTLRDRLASGTAGRVLTLQGAIDDTPALLADLDAVFPTAPGVTVVGPTVQLIWADLVHFDIGVFIEMPGPTRVVLLGSAHAEIQRDGETYLNIRVDILGDIDVRATKAAFDAVLIDSHLLGTLDLTGGAAFRLSGGDQPYAVLTLGGFHPAYNPEPLKFPASLTRIAMVHGTPNDELYLRFEGYFAITSNTLQFGAAVEALMQSGNFKVHGTLSFDALIQFVPFHFQFDIRASVHVSYKGHNLAGLTLTGALSGPGPVVLRAKVCIELLFFDICFSHTFELGPPTPPPLPPAPDVLTALLAELVDPARLRGQSGDPHVEIRPPDPDGAAVPVILPIGPLVWEQHKAPLELLLDRVGGTPLSTPAQVSATASTSTTATADWFPPGQFVNLSDDQALTRPAYELLPSGLRLAGGPGTDGPAAQTTLQINEIRLPTRAVRPTRADAFPTWLMSGPARKAAPLIAVTTEAWTVAGPGGVLDGLPGAQARRLADLTTTTQAVPSTDQLSAFAF
jgi:hypothetical protein